MTTLLKNSLQESDAAVLVVIAQFWGIKEATRIDTEELAETVQELMTDAEQAEKAWMRLDDAQRGVFQTLLGASGKKMALPMFERLHGKIRKMGAGAIEREKPLENPASIAEGLYYRGLIYEGFEQTSTGIRPVVYIPPELIESLPTHQTAYDNLEPENGMEGFAVEEGLTIEEIDPDTLEDIRPADTTIVDDLTTLLGYLQVNGGEISADGDLDAADREELLPHMLNQDDLRLTFLFKVGISANLIAAQGKQVSPRRAEARRWLEEQRAGQLKWLVDAWKESVTYLDMWHVPGLSPEPTGWSYDPRVAREAVIGFLHDFALRQAWWSLDEFITTIKETEPDFQRPGGGDYESWYIRGADGEYLTGFESWDTVEGSLLMFMLARPMHWLGMLDTAEDAARLTAYGRAFVGLEDWPTPQSTGDVIIVEDNGTLLISRRVPRIDRFQAMRFTTWGDPGDGSPYHYKLDAVGIRRADEQEINTGHITAFLNRVLEDNPIPDTIVNLLDTWQSGPSANVTMERLIVLRTTSPETMDFIVDKPALRRYLGAQLGEMAVIVRTDQWEALRDALGTHGIEVDIRHE